MVKSFLFSLLLCSTLSFAQEVNIIPQPVKVVKNAGNFVINAQTSLVVTNKEDNATATFLNSYLSDYYGFKLPVAKKASKKYIKLGSLKNIAGLKGEGYSLISDKNGKNTSARIRVLHLGCCIGSLSWGDCSYHCNTKSNLHHSRSDCSISCNRLHGCEPKPINGFGALW